MARINEIFKENDTNMKLINKKVRGWLPLQLHVIDFIRKQLTPEAELARGQSSGAPTQSRAEIAVQPRSEANVKKQKKANE